MSLFEREEKGGERERGKDHAVDMRCQRLKRVTYKGVRKTYFS
jgi:hypothetical protein